MSDSLYPRCRRHAQVQGRTELAFDTDEPLDGLRQRLWDAGFQDARIVDEAYGYCLRVTDPDGVEVYVKQCAGDYGYRNLDAGNASRAPRS